jgi:hypothetical protein
MTRSALHFFAVLIGLGFALGWLTAMPSDAGDAAKGDSVQAWVSPRHGGTLAGAAVARLVELNFGAPPALIQQPEAPPPDITLTFRREFRGLNNGLVLVAECGGGSARSLQRGDVYRDHWRIGAVSAQWIELRRQQEVRRVDLFAPFEAVCP